MMWCSLLDANCPSVTTTALKMSQPTRGRKPVVDYYLNGPVNMYLELVKKRKSTAREL